jgi:zinc protease
MKAKGGVVKAKGNLLCLLIVWGGFLGASEVIPFSSAVRKTVLPNGLTLLLRHNQEPRNRLELRLVVRVGSLVEDEDQQGLAHFTEHMAFNGSKHFRKNELVDVLEQAGVRFGSHLNAYTSFDQTVYELPIPADQPELLDKALLVLLDWARYLSFSREAIEGERGVVLEEWRLGQGAQERMRAKYFPELMAGSRYADRLPIGKKEILERFKRKTIRRFYKDWYRPDLMAVVAVGDFDMEVLEAKLMGTFLDWDAPKSPRPLPSFPIPLTQETKVMVLRDDENTQNRIQLFIKAPKRPPHLVATFEQELMDRLYSLIMGQRFDDLSRQPSPPFLYAWAGFGNFFELSQFSVGLSASPEKMLAGLDVVIREIKRAQQLGFTQQELTEAKAELLSGYEGRFLERQKTHSRRWTRELVRHFVSNGAVPGTEWEWEQARLAMEQTDLERINHHIATWFDPAKVFVLVSGTGKHEEGDLPSEQEVARQLQLSWDAAVIPLEEIPVPDRLLATDPLPGKVIEEQSTDHGFLHWQLSNGMHLLFKPTDFKDNEVLIRLESHGGTDYVEDERFFSARQVISFVQESGIAEFDVPTLSRMAKGKRYWLSPELSQHSESFFGFAEPDDLPWVFQSLHLAFTQPRFDANAWESYKENRLPLVRRQLDAPNYYFSDAVNRFLYPDSPRQASFLTEEAFKAAEVHEMEAIYRERFAHPQDWWVVVVGRYEAEALKHLVETYLGSLPPSSVREKPRDLGIRMQTQQHELTVYRGVDQKSEVRLLYHQERPYDAVEDYHLDVLAEILQIKMVEVLREELGGVYAAGASAFAARIPYEYWRLSMNFPCGPDKAKVLANQAVALLEDLALRGPSQKDVDKVVESNLRTQELNERRNRYWAARGADSFRYDQPLSTLVHDATFLKAVTPGDVRRIAAQLLKTKPYRAFLFPASMAPQEKGATDSSNHASEERRAP